MDNNLVKEYNTIREAAKEVGSKPYYILMCCDKKSKSHKGFKWQFN